MPRSTQSPARPARSEPRPTRAQSWTTLSKDGLAVLQAEPLTALPWLVHGFSTKLGGTSSFNGQRVLNLGHVEWDSSNYVARNRHQFLAALGADEMKLVTLRQIHSDIAHPIEDPPAHAPRGDAAFTRSSGLLLAVGTADCVPILLADTKHRAVAAVHAGWRGTMKRIVAKTLGRMQMEFGTQPQDVVAALGPAIGRCCYEVGPEVTQAYAAQFAAARDWFDGSFDRLATGEEPNPLPWLTMAPPGHTPRAPCVRLDLHAANRWQLADAGVRLENIVASDLCTACHTDLLFSYRREKPHTGRLWGVIGLRQGEA